MSNPSAIVLAGARPVLVECGEDYALDVEALRRHVEGGARWLLLSCMRGNVARLDELLDVCARHGVTVIEDCAHAMGVSWRGIPMGRFGKVGVFSTQSHKVVNAGEGGCSSPTTTRSWPAP